MTTHTIEARLAEVLPCECYSRHSRGEVRHWPHCLIHDRPAILALIRDLLREERDRVEVVVADELSGEFYGERGTREAVMHRIRALEDRP